MLFLFLGPLTRTELQEIAEHANLNNSDLNHSLFPDSEDDEDVWDEPRNINALCQDETIFESDEECGVDHAKISGRSEDDSDDNVPLATRLLTVKNKANCMFRNDVGRQWKRTHFAPQFADYQPAV